jgi:hypothetical protein
MRCNVDNGAFALKKAQKTESLAACATLPEALELC